LSTLKSFAAATLLSDTAELTKDYHENADKAAYSRACHADETRPSATKRPAIHQIRPRNVSRDLNRSSDERNDVDITM